MSGTDAIVINTRERASSDDINDLQSLKDRTLLDSLLEAFQSRTYAVGAQPTETSQPIVLGGLEVGPSGNDIAVQPGVLLQNSLTLTPVPGPLDSDYRWAGLRASIIITNPLPGGNTWYLIEAQMDDIVAATATVDIFDTGTGLFVPTLVNKRTERTVAATLLAGDATNLPIPSGGNLVVIGAVLVPVGGGAIPAANFMDMRPLVDDLAGAVRPAASQGRRQTIIETLEGPNVANKDWIIQAEAWIGGRRLWFETNEVGIQLVPNLATFLDGVTTPSAVSTLSFLYLSPMAIAGSPSSFVRNPYAQQGLTTMNGNALLVWSTNPPGADRMTNSVALALPAPFDNYLVPIGEAVCIGALHTDAGGLLVGQGSLGTNFQTVDAPQNAAPGWTDTVAPTGGSDAYTLADVPACARTIRCRLRWVRNAGGTVGEEVFIQDTGAGSRWVQFFGNWDVSGQVEFTIPRRTTFEIEFDGATPPTTAVLDLIGWSL